MTLDEKMEAVRSRVHNLSDKVQEHVGTLNEHAIYIAALKERVDKLTADVATSAQLNGVKEHLLLQLQVTKTQLEGMVAETQLKVFGVSEKLDPIQRGVFWLITMVVGAVIYAVLSMVIGHPLITTKP